MCVSRVRLQPRPAWWSSTAASPLAVTGNWGTAAAKQATCYVSCRLLLSLLLWDSRCVCLAIGLKATAPAAGLALTATVPQILAHQRLILGFLQPRRTSGRCSYSNALWLKNYYGSVGEGQFGDGIVNLLVDTTATLDISVPFYSWSLCCCLLLIEQKFKIFNGEWPWGKESGELTRGGVRPASGPPPVVIWKRGSLSIRWKILELIN